MVRFCSKMTNQSIAGKQLVRALLSTSLFLNYCDCELPDIRQLKKIYYQEYLPICLLRLNHQKRDKTTSAKETDLARKRLHRYSLKQGWGTIQSFLSIKSLLSITRILHDPGIMGKKHRVELSGYIVIVFLCLMEINTLELALEEKCLTHFLDGEAQPMRSI